MRNPCLHVLDAGRIIERLVQRTAFGVTRLVVTDIHAALHARENIEDQDGKSFMGIARRHFAQRQIDAEDFRNHDQAWRWRFARPMQECPDAVAVERRHFHRLTHDFDHCPSLQIAGRA